MNITLSPVTSKKSISFKELMARLGLHILSQMLFTVTAGLTALKTDDWKAVTVFICLILGNGLSVVTAFLDKASSSYDAESEASETALSDSSVNLNNK